MADDKLLSLITDHLNEGIIFVDENKRIRLFNQKAKEITGIIYDKPNTHPSSAIEEGDIVILADNEIGNDDGNLTPDDLKLLNIKDPDIQKGDALLAIGVYLNPSIQPVYKYFRGSQHHQDFILEDRYLGFQVQITISNADHFIEISINGSAYRMNFLDSVGHMVIIDGKNGQIKFFQSKGYTIRKEALNEILHGKAFLGKGVVDGDLNVIGEAIEDIFEAGPLTESIQSLLSGKETQLLNTYFQLNKRLTICSLYAIREEDSSRFYGVLLTVQDVSELDQLLSDRNQLIAEIEQKHRRAAAHQMSSPSDAILGFVGNSPASSEVKYLACKAAKSKFNVIITGESGTGKSLLARTIHNLNRKNTPFVEVNCNAIAPSLFESELFGYVGGAFTGALSSGRCGYFENANGGTIFLDEIGDLPGEIQVKLLHVLQNKIIYRVGSTKPIPIDVRVIAATNKNLEQEVKNGTFRQDLFYRINVFPIEIPPLRERKTDLYLLINNILEQVCTQCGLPQKQLSGAALNRMLHYSWPGNVRELENIIERAVTICESSMIYPEHINLPAVQNTPPTLKHMLEEAEKQILRNALKQNSGNKQRVMEDLGLSRSVLYEKLKKYGFPTDFKA